MKFIGLIGDGFLARKNGINPGIYLITDLQYFLVLSCQSNQKQSNFFHSKIDIYLNDRDSNRKFRNIINF